MEDGKKCYAIFRYAQFASVWLWREGIEHRARVYPSSYTAEFNERFRGILAITRSVGWGASYLLRSYYDGDLKDTSLEIQNKQDGPVTAADIAVNHYILETTN